MSRQRRTTSSVRYAFDERNRFILVDPRDVLQPKRVLEGRLRTDTNNRLVYLVDSSSGRDDYAGPKTFQLDGIWSLTDNHELALTVHEREQQTQQTLFLKGALVKAEANTLIFALRRSENDDLQTAQRLSLLGRWAADAHNRLNFLVEKADGSEDRLTLQGGWELGKHHELIYRYRQRRGDRLRDERALIFDGAWDVTASDRLTYRLAGSSDPAFEFTASLQTPSQQAREGRLVYRVGIGVSDGRAATRRVALFGTWKLNADKSVSFEVPYADGRRQSIRFSATVVVAKKNEVTLQLLTRHREPLGISLTFTRRLLGDTEWFVRLSKEGKEVEALGGVRVRF